MKRLAFFVMGVLTVAACSGEFDRERWARGAGRWRDADNPRLSMSSDACERVKRGEDRSSVTALLGVPDVERAQLDIYYLGLAPLDSDQTQLRVYYAEDAVARVGIYYSEESAMIVCSDGRPFPNVAVDP